jgi:hypothetical protein
MRSNVFSFFGPKASVMHYWKGPRQTLKETPMRYSMDDDPNLFLKPGPSRKLKFVLELLLVMMHLSLGLLVHDLACLFQISDSIFITWIKLMRLELSHLIVWPGKHVIKENRPLCFKNFIHMFVALLQ